MQFLAVFGLNKHQKHQRPNYRTIKGKCREEIEI